MDDSVLALHVAAGALGLLVMPAVLLVRKRRRGWHGWLGRGLATLALMGSPLINRAVTRWTVHRPGSPEEIPTAAARP